jgi:oxygen-dependent protoporphyrinogen oxidase
VAEPRRVVIVGGGLSGLAAASWTQLLAAETGLDVRLTLLEAAERLGGTIGSVIRTGYLCESGPNGFLDSKPHALELCARLAISDRLLRSKYAARKRFIYSAGALKPLPEDPISFLASDLISLSGKARLAMDYFIPARAEASDDETVADFVRRRIGVEPLEVLVGPMASGVFAGDPENMGLEACFPRIKELERGFGGLIRAMLALQMQAAAAGRKTPMSAAPGGRLTCFPGGMEELITLLAGRLGEAVRKGSRVTSLEPRGTGYRIAADGHGQVEADALILAVPAYEAHPLLAGLDPGIAHTISTIPYVPLTVAHLGFDLAAVPRPLDGYGFLIPRRENRRLLGVLWASSIFSGRAPEGKVLLSTMAGGALDPWTARLGADELVQVVRGELEATMGVRGEPELVQLFRWERAVPQYTPGHLARLRSIDKRLGDHPGLFLTGNAFRGVSINDCIHSGKETAARVVEYFRVS